MSEYRCSQCGTTYTFDEYQQLDSVPLNDEADDPLQEGGFEHVCEECGAEFHSDKWQLKETVDVDGEEILVSTVALLIPHGLNHDQWFETCIFHDTGSRVTDRYETQEKAEDGHQDRIEQLEAGEFEFRPTGRQIEMGADDA